MAGILTIFDEESLDLTLKSSFPTLKCPKKAGLTHHHTKWGLDFGSEIKSSYLSHWFSGDNLKSRRFVSQEIGLKGAYK